MRDDRIGNLEELILMMVILVHEEAYGVTVRKAYIKHCEQDISLSAVHKVLRRLEEKGFTKSVLGGESAERGGRRKRLYQLTSYGYKILRAQQEQRARIWSIIPDLKF